MTTPIKVENKDFTDICHKLAQGKIYTGLFNTSIDRLIYKDTSLNLGPKERILDGAMGIDRIVEVNVYGHRANFPFTVQERFRRPENVKYKDITITMWNPKSDLPSELYKLYSHLFVYGYGNDENNPTDFIDCWVFNTAEIVLKFITGIFKNGKDYRFDVNPRTEQPFLGIKIKSLIEHGCCLYDYKNNGNGKATQATFF